MTATDIVPAPRTREYVQAQHPHRTTPRTLKVTRIVRRAIEAMVWQGLKRDDAAIAAGMQPNSLYVALRRPDVKALYNSECEVLRLSGRARRITRLEELVEQDDNKQAAINACLALDRIDADQHQRNNGQQLSPGLVIVVNGGNVTTDIGRTQASTAPQVIDNDE